MNAPNPKLPNASRTYLADKKLEQAMRDYTIDAYSTINRFLREGGRLEARDRATHEALRKAFEELSVFEKPIKVFRALNLPEEEASNYLQTLLDARNGDELVSLKGYLSCTTNSALLPLGACLRNQARR